MKFIYIFAFTFCLVSNVAIGSDKDSKERLEWDEEIGNCFKMHGDNSGELKSCLNMSRANFWKKVQPDEREKQRTYMHQCNKYANFMKKHGGNYVQDLSSCMKELNPDLNVGINKK